MLQSNQAKNIYYTLRIACAMCFIGHGAFGIITKEVWCNYFAVAGIGHDMAYTLMPYVGTIDILIGLIILFYPVRIVFAWLIVWGFTTAMMRPLSGEPFAEFIERAGNYGAPLALLLLTYTKENKWLKPVSVQHAQLNDKNLQRVKLCLRIVVFLLLLGHGWLNILEKKALLAQYHSLGFSNPANVAHIVGALEMLAAVSTLIKPIHSILILFFIWKMFSELFYPHWEVFEFIERGGSYGAILALWFLTKPSASYYFTNKQQHTTASAL